MLFSEEMRMQKRPPPPEQGPGPGVEDAAAEYIDQAEAYRRYVQEGLDDVAAGRTRPWAEVEAELREKYGDFDD